MQVIIFIIVFCGACVGIWNGVTEWREGEIRKERDRGQEIGYSVGYSEVEKVFTPKVEEQRLLYMQKLQKQKNLYDKKIDSAKKDGLYKGKQDRSSEIEKKIDDKAKNLQEKGKWDSVLYDVR